MKGDYLLDICVGKYYLADQTCYYMMIDTFLTNFLCVGTGFECWMQLVIKWRQSSSLYLLIPFSVPVDNEIFKIFILNNFDGQKQYTT